MVLQTKLYKCSQKPSFSDFVKHINECETQIIPMHRYNKLKHQWENFEIKNHCHNKLCPKCQGRLFIRASKKIEKRIGKFRYFKLLTLTLNSNKMLYEGKKYLIERFKAMLKKYKKKTGKNFPRYLYAYEYTYNEKIDRYHHHLHIIVATHFLPYEIVKECWGEGFIFISPECADKQGAIKYIAKYVSKFTQPISFQDYFRYFYKQRFYTGSLLLDYKVITETQNKRYIYYLELDETYLTQKGISQILKLNKDGG